MTPVRPTAIMLADAIEKSELTQREIADRIGFKNANIILILKTGEARVPLDRNSAEVRDHDDQIEQSSKPLPAGNLGRDFENDHVASSRLG